MKYFGIFASSVILTLFYAGIFLVINTTEGHSTTSANRQVVVSGPLKQQVHKRIRTQMKDIRIAVKTGKLTPDQAKTLKLTLINTRKQEVIFLKQNGGNDLTVDQQSQLNQTLDKNSVVLGETQVSSAP